MSAKTAQLQIRVSSSEKAFIRSRARTAGMDISAWVLHQLLSDETTKFEELVAEWPRADTSHYAVANLNDFLTSLPKERFRRAVENRPNSKLSPFQENYLAAMIEIAALKKGIQPPNWTKSVPPLEDPYFASDLQSLRLHLLVSSPIPFRRRNIFVDATIGDRV